MLMINRGNNILHVDDKYECVQSIRGLFVGVLYSNRLKLNRTNVSKQIVMF